MADGTGARKVSRREFLDERNLAWGPRLRKVSLAAEANIPEKHHEMAARALSDLYFRGNYTTEGKRRLLTMWPACLVAAMTGVAVMKYQSGTYWPKLEEAVGYEFDPADQKMWGKAFQASADRLGLPVFDDPSSRRYVRPVLMHAGIPRLCLLPFLSLLAERRRQDPGLDTDGFLAWATAPGREARLSALHKPAEEFLLSGGEYAHDIVDRTLDLLERLTGPNPDPDLDGIGLPAYMTEAAREYVADRRLDLEGTRRVGRDGTSAARQARPRIALDPYGAGVHVLLPAVGDMPDGVARWRVTADGETRTVQSRALWVGAAEAAPETAHPLHRPVRTVLVSLVGRDDLTAELRVVEQADPVLFFAEDGRRLTGNLPLPRARVWIMHPAKHDLKFSGDTGPVTQSPVPFGWDGWKLMQVSLQDVQTVGLDGGRTHQVELQARPALLLDEPVPGVTTPYGSPVYGEAPALFLPASDAGVAWHCEVRRVGDDAPLVSRTVGVADELDIWGAVPRPLLGAFEVTVRGPLGRGLRRTIVIAEGLSVHYEPKARLLSGTGLMPGKAILRAVDGATALPATVRFGPGERTRPVEYRAGGESEPLFITPPHAELLCPGAGITTWTTSLLRLVTEDYAAAGRLLVRLPLGAQGRQAELELYVGERLVQAVPASGQHSAGLLGFELGRAADTIAAHRGAALVLKLSDAHMPVGHVRPRTLASGAELCDGALLIHDAAPVEGLTAGLYLVYAPWRPPAELPVGPDGSVPLPGALRDAGPVSVLVRINDPWVASNWPAWPGAGAYTCDAPGSPASDDPDERALSRFVAGETDLPALTSLGRLWRLVNLAPSLTRLGARADLAARCTEELLRRPRAAFLALVDEDLSNADVIRLLIATGLATAPGDPLPWPSAEQDALERLWAAFPAAAAIAIGPSLGSPEGAEPAAAHCGDSITAMLGGRSDPHATVGRFGPEAERMEQLSPEAVDLLWEAAAVVPQALLDADTRAAAARRMFDARETAAMRSVASVAKTATRAAEVAIGESFCPGLTESIAVRRPEKNYAWLTLPAMSIAMALVARHAAWGDERCARLEREFRGKWSNLASAAPDIVAIDLVRAEAMVVGMLAGKPEESVHD